MSLFRRIHTFDSLALRDFRCLWLGQVAVAMGSWMDNVSRSWLMYQLTGSPFQLGLVSAVKALPLLVFGIVAGAVADRYGRKTQLVLAQSVNALLNIILAFLILTRNIEPWHIYGAAFLAGTVQAFQQPARQVLISELVGEKHLLNAISLNSAATNLSKSVGPALCGLLIQALGVDWSYFVQGGFYALATVWTVQIRIPQAVTRAAYLEYGHAGTNQSLINGIRDGMKYVLSQKLILALLVLGLAPVLLGMPFTSLMPIFAIEVFRGNAQTQGLLLTMLGIGALAGALTMASLGKWQGSGKLLIAGAAGFGLSLALFAYSPVLSIAMFFVFLAGVFNTSYSSQNMTMLQLLTPPELRGRVLGIRLLDRGLQPLGSLLAGALATFLGGPTAVAIMGASCFLLAIAVGLSVRSLWRLKYPVREKEPGLPLYLPGE